MTSQLTIGSLFSGYGGLDMAAEHVFGARTAWVSDIDKGARKVLAHRYPHVPNLGDITTINWATVEPVDIITGGSPCQDLSTAGRRAGMTDGTRSNLWVAMREAIANVQPTYVIWENVRGAFSAHAASDLEPCPGCVGDGRDKPALRALGRVLGDLAQLGYDAEWRGLRASDVGACHQRFRVFVLAWRRAPHDTGRIRGHEAVEHDGRRSSTGDRAGVPHESDRHADEAGPDGGLTLLPSPVAQPSGNSPEVHLRKKPGRTVVTDLAILVENGLLETGGRLLPTPEAKLATSGPDFARANRPGTGGDSLHETVARMLPTPRATDGTKGGPNQRGSSGDLMLPSAVMHHEQFGQYAAAIARHERMLGRPAPSPVEPGRNGKPRLSAAFTEWMMGLPDGWITDAPGVTRNEALKLCGNGVVPHQAAAALTDMLAASQEVAA